MNATEPSTIAAISTPPGTGGIGIIRISGPGSIKTALKIFKPKKSVLKEEAHYSSRKIYVGHIVDPITSDIVDEAVLFFMKAPHSYTGEDVTEIQVHGSTIVLHTILELVLRQGVLLAEPGEFTRRAFLNGRIDLIQAESIIDLIHAKTKRAALLSTSLLKGDLGLRFQKIKSELVDLLSQISAAIDFPDEDIDTLSHDALLERLDHIIHKEINTLITSYQSHHYLREGVKVGIAGPPNVGKSSLLNRLVDKEKSIVTAIPGTTRDIIEEAFILNGVPLIISDTAGIHETQDLVETIGIHKAISHLEETDIILLVLDASKEITSLEKGLYDRLAHKTIILVLNKIDLVEPLFSPDMAYFKSAIDALFISAKTNEGISHLKAVILKTLHPESIEKMDPVVPNLRQQQGLQFIHNRLIAAQNGISHSLPFELIAIDLTACIDKIGEITGETTPVDIFDMIFKRFCIGK